MAHSYENISLVCFALITDYFVWEATELQNDAITYWNVVLLAYNSWNRIKFLAKANFSNKETNTQILVMRLYYAKWGMNTEANVENPTKSTVSFPVHEERYLVVEWFFPPGFHKIRAESGARRKMSDSLSQPKGSFRDYHYIFASWALDISLQLSCNFLLIIHAKYSRIARIVDAFPPSKSFFPTFLPAGMEKEGRNFDSGNELKMPFIV